MELSGRNANFLPFSAATATEAPSGDATIGVSPVVEGDSDESTVGGFKLALSSAEANSRQSSIQQPKFDQQDQATELDPELDSALPVQSLVASEDPVDADPAMLKTSLADQKSLFASAGESDENEMMDELESDGAELKQVPAGLTDEKIKDLTDPLQREQSPIHLAAAPVVLSPARQFSDLEAVELQRPVTLASVGGQEVNNAVLARGLLGQVATTPNTELPNQAALAAATDTSSVSLLKSQITSEGKEGAVNLRIDQLPGMEKLQTPTTPAQATSAITAAPTPGTQLPLSGSVAFHDGSSFGRTIDTRSLQLESTSRIKTLQSLPSQNVQAAQAATDSEIQSESLISMTQSTQVEKKNAAENFQPGADRSINIDTKSIASSLPASSVVTEGRGDPSISSTPSITALTPATIGDTRVVSPITSSVSSLPEVDMSDASMPAKLGSHIRLMAEGGVQSAVVQVKPAELGPLQIEVSMDKERLVVNITAAQAATRELLDSSLPRLREQLASQQFTQIDVQVSDQGRGQGTFSGQGNPSYGQAPDVYPSIGRFAMEQDIAGEEPVTDSLLAEVSNRTSHIDAYV
ncbi:MAG: flagellar hook-length control protein FliK [Granulosicoccus sp.]|nr:flagellar hook-length control protein FliK [Granulosicoccus sp.]